MSEYKKSSVFCGCLWANWQLMNVELQSKYRQDAQSKTGEWWWYGGRSMIIGMSSGHKRLNLHEIYQINTRERIGPWILISMPISSKWHSLWHQTTLHIIKGSITGLSTSIQWYPNVARFLFTFGIPAWYSSVSCGCYHADKDWGYMDIKKRKAFVWSH